MSTGRDRAATLGSAAGGLLLPHSQLNVGCDSGIFAVEISRSPRGCNEIALLAMRGFTLAVRPIPRVQGTIAAEHLESLNEVPPLINGMSSAR